METVVLIVEGMSCAHCENAVKSAVGALTGVQDVAVSLRDKTVTVRYSPAEISPDKIRAEIADQGYDVAP